MVGEAKRHQMMQNLFGDQSEEEEEEEEEIDSEHESNPQPPDDAYASEEVERVGGADVGIERQGEAEAESEGDLREIGHESEGEREEEYDDEEVEGSIQKEEQHGRGEETDSEEKEEYSHRGVTSRRNVAVESASEGSGKNAYVDHNDEEVDQRGRQPIKKTDQSNPDQSAPEIRDVFGDSEEEEEEEPPYAAQNNEEQEQEQDFDRSPMEEGSFGNDLRPEDMLADEEGNYQSEDEHYENKLKEKPVGPALLLDIPLRHPPATPDKLNLIKVSNIMAIDPKPFDPKTFQEDDVFVTDESGSQKRIRLENNTVRWRVKRNRDGTESYESNARFVKWSDGSLQLLIGNEVLDISAQDAQHDQAHLFLRHGKGILQSQGRILSKMRFMPSSLSSNSHRLLTALVDSRHKKVHKVKNCITDIDPEREKEEKERALSQTLRANAILNRKREKVTRKYAPTERTRQLSPGFLEEALDEDEQDYYDARRSRRHYEDDLESEARAEKRIMNAKRPQGHRPIPRRAPAPPARSSKRPVDFSDSDRDESEYETDGDDYERSPPKKRQEVREPEYDDEEEEEYQDEEEAEANASPEEARKESRQRGSLKRKDIESDEESPPAKQSASHRRKALVYDSEDD